MTPPRDRLLLVDDDASSREVLSRRLQGQGYAVEVSGDVADAMDKIARAHYDLVLLDQVGPGTGAIDLLRLLRATYTRDDLPVILVTPHRATAVQAFESGANDCVKWPPDVPMMTARIDAQLSRSKSDRETRSGEHRDALAARGSERGAWEWDLASNRVYISPAWAERMGFPENQGDVGAFWRSMIHPEDAAHLRDEVEAHLAGNTTELRVEYRLLDSSAAKGGRCRRVLSRGHAIRSADGTPVRLIGTIMDLSPITPLDPLTELGTRQTLLERLASVPAMFPIAILLLDLDGFKLMNDSFGHSVGDRILREVASRVRSTVADLNPGGTTAISRIGGDEFTIFLEGETAHEQAVVLAKRLLPIVARPIMIDDFQLTVSASLGVVLEGASHSRPHEILRDAELAMYHAKEKGRNRWQMFEPCRRELAFTRMAMLRELRYATGQNQLLALYQAKVDLTTGRIIGFEALLRWLHPDRGMLMPVDFIPLAEETGQIVPMGEWILRAACRQLKHWQTVYPEFRDLNMSVNLSVRQLNDPGLVGCVRKILEETGISPESLKLELTESTLMKDLPSAKDVLGQLQAMGVGLALDDFGTGYSSLSYLRALHFNSLKIDRSFIAKLATDREARAIVDTIVKLAHTLGMRVVAEGIEDTDQAGELARMDCDAGQGYYFSRPVKAVDAEELLKTGLAWRPARRLISISPAQQPALEMAS